MSPLEKLSDKALLLLINQIREEFVDNDVYSDRVGGEETVFYVS
jgi:hypothetical protein